MPTPAFARGRLCVGMTVRGIDHESELLAVGISRWDKVVQFWKTKYTTEMLARQSWVMG